jgi:hypothetical protein
MIIKSVSDDQNSLIDQIINMHCGGELDADVTFSKGNFYGNIKPRLMFDKTPLNESILQADCREIPINDASLNSLMFDPPFIIGQFKNTTDMMCERFTYMGSSKEL